MSKTADIIHGGPEDDDEVDFEQVVQRYAHQSGVKAANEICLVCSSGGHLTEIMLLCRFVDPSRIVFATHRSDMSESLANKVYSPQYGERWWQVLFTMISGFVVAARFLVRTRPRWIISTGAEIAVPFFVVGKMLGIRTIFVESYTRVTRLSRTGMLLLPLSDSFFVQWASLYEMYRKNSVFKGAIL